MKKDLRVVFWARHRANTDHHGFSAHCARIMKKGETEMRRQLTLRMAGILAAITLCGAIASSALADTTPLCEGSMAGLQMNSQCEYLNMTAISGLAGMRSSVHICVELKSPRGSLFYEAVGGAWDNWGAWVGTAHSTGASVCEEAPYAVQHIVGIYWPY